MGKLKETRDALVADLSVLGVPVMDGWKLSAEPPCVLLTPAVLYVEGGEQFAHSYVINIDAAVLVRNSSIPDHARTALEDLLETLLINTADWSLKGVDAPTISTVSGSTVEFLGTVVRLAKAFHL
jgi:hypothetical protein